MDQLTQADIFAAAKLRDPITITTARGVWTLQAIAAAHGLGDGGVLIDFQHVGPEHGRVQVRVDRNQLTNEHVIERLTVYLSHDPLPPPGARVY